MYNATVIDESDVREAGGGQVRETLDFAARCQGAGNKPQELRRLLDLEAQRGISPDPSTDAFMKVLHSPAFLPLLYAIEHHTFMLLLSIASRAWSR